MYESKLQIGCLIIVIFLSLIYYSQCYRYKTKHHFSLFNILIITGIFSLIMDGVTAYTVNHLDLVTNSLNLLLHTLFLIGIDSVVFILFLYMITSTGYFPNNKKIKLLIFLPFVFNITIVVLGRNTLEFIKSPTGNYSTGLSAYTYFALVGIYTLLTCIVFIKRWNYIEKNNKINIIIYLTVLVSVTLYQALNPQVLVSSIATATLILGVYLNQEDPAIVALSHYHNEMVMGFATLIENRDESTGEHVRRTTSYVLLLTDELKKRGYYSEKLTKDYLNNLYMAAPLHDIGKIAVPDSILQKPDKLTIEEFEQIKKHTKFGGQIIRETFSSMGNDEYLKVAYNVARYHHEKWDGKGYPENLKETDIPLCARIMAIADVFDAVSEKRCYRDALPIDECFDIIKEGKGTAFDPLLVDIFLSLRTDIEQVHNSKNDGS